MILPAALGLLTPLVTGLLLGAPGGRKGHAPFKDIRGPSLNILIKLMSMVSVVIASLVVRYSAVALGWL